MSPSTKVAEIDVCIATYRRPTLLLGLLESIEAQELGSDIACRIIVVDNDADGSGRDTVERFAAKSRYPVRYEVEPIKGISAARNRALELSSGEFIATIDDDEVADPHWLQTLFDACQRFEAGMVFGPVHPLFPEGAPSWAVNGGFFDARHDTTGAFKNEGGAGNALIRQTAMGPIDFRFDPSFDLTGGEDTELFHRASQANVKMVWCEEAVTYERIVPERMTIRWLVRRSFRIGQTVETVFGLPSPLSNIRQFLKHIIFIFLGTVQFLLALPFDKARSVQNLRDASYYLGRISTLTKYRYREYS